MKYGMFTKAGDYAVEGIAKTALACLENGVENSVVEEIIADALYKLSFLLGCKEATDTMVADRVFEVVQRRWDLYRDDCNRARFADVNL